MARKFIFRKIIYIILPFIFITNSCKVDEFKWNELGIKDGWSTRLVVPLFHGDMEFKDFIIDWFDYEDNYSFDEPLTTLEYNEFYYRTIPTELIFDPSVIVDSFPLQIQGDYELDSISLLFRVTNASPYPLNLELNFFNKVDGFPSGQPISPDSFDAGIINGNSINPAFSTHTIEFTPEQVEVFNNSDRVQFTSWYTDNGFAKDTLSVHYPIEVSIILLGAIKSKDENK